MSVDVHIVILAAGSSSRLGRPKQLVSWQGEPLLRHLARQALATGAPVTTILGASSESIRPALAQLPVHVLQNDLWPEGMSSSIRLAAGAINSEALLFMTCDQLCVTTAHLGALIQAHQQHCQKIIASEYGSTMGIPALFPKSHFSALASLHGREGAKAIIQRHLDSVDRISFPEGSRDLDTQEDLAMIASETR